MIAKLIFEKIIQKNSTVNNFLLKHSIGVNKIIDNIKIILSEYNESNFIINSINYFIKLSNLIYN